MSRKADSEQGALGLDPVGRPVSAANLLDPGRPRPEVGVLGLSQLAQAAKAGRRSRGGLWSETASREATNASDLLAEVGPAAKR